MTSLVCASDNRAETALKAFLSGVKGGCLYICNWLCRCLYICNQRIERLHYDTTHCVLSHYIDLFLYMEEKRILDRNSIIDLFALHYIYQPRIQASLDEFKEGWNHHPVSTEKHSSLYEIRVMGIMDLRYESSRRVLFYIELNGMNVNEFGIDPDMTFNNSSENDEDHIQAQSEFDHKIDEILELLKKLFPELVGDGNHGIDGFCQVGEELLKIILQYRWYALNCQNLRFVMLL